MLEMLGAAEQFFRTVDILVQVNREASAAGVGEPPSTHPPTGERLQVLRDWVKQLRARGYN